MLQVLVYAGAVVVLFVFVIMMIGPTVDRARRPRAAWSRKAARVGADGASLTSAFAAALAVLAPERAGDRRLRAGQGAECSSSAASARSRTSCIVDDAVPFELISVLLTVAIIGAIAVARGRTRRRGRRARNKRRASTTPKPRRSSRATKLSAEVAASGGH